MTRQLEKMQEQSAAGAAQPADSDVPAWLQVRRWMIEKGQNNLPTSKRHLMSRFQQSTTLRMQLIKELPRLAAALGLNDDDVELPEVLLDLLSNPQTEPSVALGRRLLDSAQTIDQLIALAPSRQTTIRLSVQMWKQDQARLMEEGIAATRQVTEKERQRIRESIAAHGNPMVRGSAENKELRKREVLRQAGISVGPRH